MSVRIDRLGKIDDSAKLGDGGVATVYRTSLGLPSYDGPLAYKEFLTSLPVDDLERVVREFSGAVEFRRGLSLAERVELEARTAWPLETVTDGGRVVGGLMPMIRPEFFAEVRPPSSVETALVPRSFDRLSGDPATALRAGYSHDQLRQFSSPTLRLALVAHLAYTVAWLHKRGLVVGDISLKNAVFSVEPPMVMLLDCDGTARQTDSRRVQLNTPFFLAPECLPPGSNPFARGGPGLQDTQSDVYKLGLCLVRGLAQGEGVVQVTSAKHLEGVYAAEVVKLANHALSVKPTDRPTAAQFFETLKNHISVLVPPPVIHFFRAADGVVPRGSEVVFEWSVDNATTLVLHGPGGTAVSLDPRAGRCTVRAETSGTYTLHALHRGGSATLDSGLIRTFDLPRLGLAEGGLLQQLVPEIPSLPPVDIASSGVLPSRPSVEIDSDLIPEISFPTVEPLVGGADGSDTARWMSAMAAPPVADLGHLSGLGREFADAGNLAHELVSEAHERLRVELESAAAKDIADAMVIIGKQVKARAAAFNP